MKRSLFLFITIPVWLVVHPQVYSQKKIDKEPVDTSWYVRGDINYNLLVAAYLGIDKDVARFLQLGAYVNTATMSGNTPMILAAGEGHISTVEILLRQDASLNEKNKEGISPLMQATMNNRIKMIAYLLDHGAEADSRDKSGHTPLMEAAAHNRISAGNILLKHGADPNATDKQGTTPLMAAVYGGNAAFARMLMEAGARVNQKDKNGFTALMIATQKGDTTLVDYLISGGADIFVRTHSGYTPLLLAVQNKNVALAAKFIAMDTTGFFRKKLPVNPVRLANENHDRAMKDLLILNDYRENFSPFLHDLRLGPDFMFNGRNILPGIRFGITEGVTKITFSLAFNYRIYPVRILEQSSDHHFYQYWEHRGVIFAGVGRDFPFLKPAPRKPEIGTDLFVNGFFSYGPSYPGSDKSPGSIFMVSPGGGLYLKTGPVRIAADYCWLDLRTYDFPNSYFSLKIEYMLSGKKILKTNKTIPWYH